MKAIDIVIRWILTLIITVITITNCNHNMDVSQFIGS